MKVLSILLALWGVITASKADVYSSGSYNSPLESQVNMGRLVGVIEQNGIWVKINIDGAFDGWVSEKNVAFMDSVRVAEYLDAKKCICTCNYASVRAHASSAGAVVSPIVLGDSLVLAGATPDSSWLKVEFCDGRNGWVRHENVCETSRWKARNAAMPEGEKIEKIIKYASRLLGTPYVWGGASSTGVDCSGMVQLCFGMVGIQLPRNSSQQFLVGQAVPFEHFEDGHWALEWLKRGDLLFFGTPGEGQADVAAAIWPKVSHVGIYLGDGRFIQASHYVRINSLLNCDADVYENAHKLVGVKRIIGR